VIVAHEFDDFGRKCLRVSGPVATITGSPGVAGGYGGHFLADERDQRMLVDCLA
jgi:hypothetical protein